MHGEVDGAQQGLNVHELQTGSYRDLPPTVRLYPVLSNDTPQRARLSELHYLSGTRQLTITAAEDGE